MTKNHLFFGDMMGLYNKTENKLKYISRGGPLSIADFLFIYLIVLQ